MSNKRSHYIFAGASFLISFLVYLSTMQPSIPFWDCGEFAASAFGLQIGHPPGSPLWMLIGRIAMVIPTFSDPVARYNLISVLSSALTILLLYLTAARLIRMWRGEPKSMADVITTYGGAFIAAMSYTFTDSFWFNALECEVYAFGSLFIAIVPWLMLVWYDHADEEHSEKYLLLVSYIIGLSLGVHQLALLTIFPCFMLIYYRRRQKVTIMSWLGMVAASVIAFVISFKVILSKLVEWMGSTPAISIVLLAGCIAAIWYSQKNRKAILNLCSWSALLMFFGFSTYTLIMVRAAQNPPMNQWHASNFKQITKFINREQYGDRGFFPRRALDEQGRQAGPTWENYKSDAEFFWSYQTNEMYNRYLMWNFVGRVSQRQGVGIDWTKTLGLAFFLGLFGLYWHFRRDPKRALAFFALFAMLGWATAWYQNQQDPQPRERDYFYVGAFYVFAIWVGIGATGLMEIARKKKKTEDEEDENAGMGIPTGMDGKLAITGGVFALALIAAPLNQCVGLAGMAMGQTFEQSSKWHEYDRSHNYIPLESAYNVLQSCDKDAILFTAGDNDTFPLWCAQDVYGIRRDVRIVNLSLANMGWYIKQLLRDQWEIGKKINLPGFTDETIDQPDDSEGGVRAYSDDPKDVSVQVSAETMRRFTGVADAPAAMMSWRYTGEFGLGEGKYYFAVADQIVKSIVEGNINTRPIYFANLVPGNYLIGLNPYLVTVGMVKQVTPLAQNKRQNRMDEPIDEPLLAQTLLHFVDKPVLTPKRAFMMNTFMDPAAHWSNDDRTNDPYFYSYQNIYINLAKYYIRMEQPQLAKEVLDTLSKRMPPDRVRYIGISAQAVMKLYKQAGDEKSAKVFGEYALKDLLRRLAVEKKSKDRDNESLASYLLSAEIQLELGKPQPVVDTLSHLIPTIDQRERPQFELRLLQAQAMVAESKGDKQGALKKYNELLTNYGQAMANSSEYQYDYLQFVEKRSKLMSELGLKQDTTAAPGQRPVQ